MPKPHKVSLQKALSTMNAQSVQEQGRARIETPPQAGSVSSAGSDPRPSSRAAIRPPSRRQKKFIGGYYDPEVSIQLLQIGISRRHDGNNNGQPISLQELVREALNDFFEKHGVPRIA